MMGASVSAQTEAELQVTPTVETAEVGETVEYKVILQPATDGVGTYRFSARLSDPAVATITDVSLGGEPDLTEINYSETGDQVDIRAALADTPDRGEVLVATITVELDEPGSTAIELADVVVGDENGFGYTIEQTNTELTAVESTEKRISVTPVEQSVTVGEEAAVEIVLEDAVRGVGAYNISLSVNESSAMKFTEVSLTGEPEFQEVEYSEDRNSVQIRAAPADTAQTGAVTIATATLTGEKSSHAVVRPSAQVIGDKLGYEYSIAKTEASTVAVNSKEDSLPVIAEREPVDINNDGVYEDLNGDNEVTALDVQLLYSHRESDVVQQNEELLDFNWDGEVDITNVQALFEIMASSST